MTTKVTYRLDKEGNFQFISICDHANYDKKNKDIVCAGISAITYGTISFLQNYYKDICQVSYLSTEITIRPVVNSSDCQLCLKMMIHQLKNIASFYQRYLIVSEE